MRVNPTTRPKWVRNVRWAVPGRCGQDCQRQSCHEYFIRAKESDWCGVERRATYSLFGIYFITTFEFGHECDLLELAQEVKVIGNDVDPSYKIGNRGLWDFPVPELSELLNMFFF